MGGAGFLVPPWYVSVDLDELTLNICSMIWGFSICAALFAGMKGVSQARQARLRGKLFRPYIIMIWMEWASSFIISVVSWFYLKGIIPPSFWFYFFLLCLWVVQMHCILQIIINRVSLIMMNKARARQLRISVFIIVVLINISVFCIWIPARLQINETYVRLNDIWDRVEKSIFAVVDAGLNAYFIYTVRTKLISCGLTKYQDLFRYNVAMICVSMLLDVILIGSMSIGSGLIYIQFHPLVYLLKLYIEMNMADLIIKVVNASSFGSPKLDGTRTSTMGNSARKSFRPSSTTQMNRLSTGTTTFAENGMDWPKSDRCSTAGRSDILGQRHMSRPNPYDLFDELDDDDNNNDGNGNDGSTNSLDICRRH